MAFYDSDPGRTSNSGRRDVVSSVGTQNASYKPSSSTHLSFLAPATAGSGSASPTPATVNLASGSTADSVSTRSSLLLGGKSYQHQHTTSRGAVAAASPSSILDKISTSTSRGIHTQGPGTGKSVLPTLRMMEERQQAAAAAAQKRSAAVHGSSALTPGVALAEGSLLQHSTNLSTAGISPVRSSMVRNTSGFDRSSVSANGLNHSSYQLGDSTNANTSFGGAASSAANTNNTLTREEEITQSLAAAAMSPKQLLERRERAAIERRSKCIDLLSTSTLPDEVKKFMASKLDEAWAAELVEMRTEVPSAAWVEWCATSMTEGPNYVFAVRAKQKSLSLF